MLDLKVITIPYLVQMKQDLTCKIHHKSGNGEARHGIMKIGTTWWACKIIHEEKRYIALFNIDGQITFWSTDEVKTVCAIRGKENSWSFVFHSFNKGSNHFKFKYYES